MAIVKNYGLRWVRDKVQWGGRGKVGSLSGKPVSARRSEDVDFRDQIAVYVLYEAGFNPVYIGQAGLGNATLFGRLKTHQNDHLRDRWSHFSWFGFKAVNEDRSLSDRNKANSKTAITYIDALHEIEGILIQVLEPRLNKRGANWQDTADEYVQAGLPPEADRIGEMHDEIMHIKVALAKVASRA